MLDARERSKVASLDAARGEEDEQGPAIDPEKLRTEDSDTVHLPVEDRIFLRDAMSRLKTLERKVVHSFYYLDLNQTEIARKLGISVNYASYLLRGGIAQLRKAFEAQARDPLLRQLAPEATEGRPSLAPGPQPPAPDSYSLSARPAPFDPVTKVATEAYLIERIEQEVARASRYPQQFSLVLVEPDSPAATLPSSDTSLAGASGPPPAPRPQTLDPATLVELARLLRANCRSIDLVARMSGARFGLLLPHTGREASVLSERICRMVENRKSRVESGESECGSRRESRRSNLESRPYTVSVGLAVYPTNGRSAEELLASAERALIEAKEQGGNRALRAEPVKRARAKAQVA
jgi:diguanylate cyclase (GGDEF)-like protein